MNTQFVTRFQSRVFVVSVCQDPWQPMPLLWAYVDNIMRTFGSASHGEHFLSPWQWLRVWRWLWSWRTGMVLIELSTLGVASRVNGESWDTDVFRCLQCRKIEILFTDGATGCSLFIFLSEVESHVVQAGLKLRMILNFWPYVLYLLNAGITAAHHQVHCMRCWQFNVGFHEW